MLIVYRSFILFLFLTSFGCANDKVAGWSVTANQADKKQLETTLKDLNDIFPAKALKSLQRVPIQVDYQYNGMLLQTGFYDVNRSIIHITSSKECSNKILLVHELSHAAMKLSIGLDNPKVKKAYQEIVDKKLYSKDSYLMANHKEYFAEMSVVYLMKLHYFPHNRATLKKHDPVSYKLMEDFWGK